MNWLTHIIELSSNFIDLLYRDGKTVHERHTEFQQETASFCFQTMKAFQLRRITDFFTTEQCNLLGGDFSTHSQLQVRSGQTGLAAPDVEVNVNDAQAIQVVHFSHDALHIFEAHHVPYRADAPGWARKETFVCCLFLATSYRTFSLSGENKIYFPLETHGVHSGKRVKRGNPRLPPT